MVSEIEAFYAGILVINGTLAAFTIFYQWRRLKIEQARSLALEQQRDNLRTYYDQRLSIEKAKLDVEQKKLALRKGNGQ